MKTSFAFGAWLAPFFVFACLGPVFGANQTPTPTVLPKPVMAAPTPTPTATLVVIATATPKATATRTPTPTVTVTFTPTSTPGVFSFKVSPHPVQGSVHFEWGSTMQCQRVTLVVYTGSFRPVSRFTFDASNRVDFLAKGVHEFVWNCLDDENRSLVPGTYLCFVSLKVNKASYEASGEFATP